MARHVALAVSAALHFVARQLAVPHVTAANGSLGVLAAHTGHRALLLAWGAWAVVAELLTLMLATQQIFTTDAPTGGLGVVLATGIVVLCATTRAVLWLPADRAVSARARVALFDARVRATILALAATVVPTAVRNGVAVVVWIHCLLTEAVVLLGTFRVLVLAAGATKLSALT